MAGAPPRQRPVSDASALAAREADELVARARQRDRAAFDALYRRYRPRVLALSLHLTGSASDAEDITQEVFLRAHRTIERFEGRSAFFTWLYRITLNLVLNRRRDSARQHAILRLNDDRVRAAVAVDAADDPGRACELRETYALLLQAFDRLTPLLRTTVVLVSLQGLSHAEAAVVLETTEGTVAWRVHRAREQLQHWMERLARDPTPLPRHRAASAAARLFQFLELAPPKV